MLLYRRSDTVGARELRSALIGRIYFETRQMSRILFLFFSGKKKKKKNVIDREFLVVVMNGPKAEDGRA